MPAIGIPGGPGWGPGRGHGPLLRDPASPVERTITSRGDAETRRGGTRGWTSPVHNGSMAMTWKAFFTMKGMKTMKKGRAGRFPRPGHPVRAATAIHRNLPEGHRSAEPTSRLCGSASLREPSPSRPHGTPVVSPETSPPSSLPLHGLHALHGEKPCRAPLRSRSISVAAVACPSRSAKRPPCL